MQCADALFNRRMAREQGHPRRTAGDAGSGDVLRQFPRLESAEAAQRTHHGLGAAHQLRGTGIGAEFTLA